MNECLFILISNDSIFLYIYLIAFNFYLVNNIAQKAIFFLLEKIY
jgi:hypothetical protein